MCNVSNIEASFAKQAGRGNDTAVKQKRNLCSCACFLPSCYCMAWSAPLLRKHSCPRKLGPKRCTAATKTAPLQTRPNPPVSRRLPALRIYIFGCHHPSSKCIRCISRLCEGIDSRFSHCPQNEDKLHRKFDLVIGPGKSAGAFYF